MDTISIKVSPELNDALDSMARRRGISKSELIREACANVLAAEDRPSSASLLDKMNGIVGALEGPGDLSTNSDYLKDYGR